MLHTTGGKIYCAISSWFGAAERERERRRRELGGHLTRKAFRSRHLERVRRIESRESIFFGFSRKFVGSRAIAYVIRGSGERSRDSPGGDKRGRSVARRFTASSHLNSSRSVFFLVRVPGTVRAIHTGGERGCALA